MSVRKPVVGPRLRRLLVLVLLLFSCLVINSIYLSGVTFIEWLRGISIQNLFYQWMFLGHLVLGLLLLLPFIVYGIVHFLNARNHRNRRAVKAGYALFGFGVVLLGTGLMLTRGLPIVELRDPLARSTAYWAHVVCTVLIIWIYILHRLVGTRIRWKTGLAVVAVAGLLSLIAIVVQSQDPRKWNQTGPESGEQYFFPSLARTVDGNFIQAQSLMMDGYCKECHQDTHKSWEMSMHRLSSFNNPAYAFSVNKTRDFLSQRDGNVQAARFCAGCHDPVPFFAGDMDIPDFGNHGEPTSQAGITCSVCHSITHVNSSRGNADYTIEAPQHYPFTFSEKAWLQWVNQTLVKAKPAFHKQTFLKPLHKTAEFCSSCHKVHLPEELNGYRWLRGQNHYDSFLLSGVSGHSVQSFYYPKKAEPNCNSCHMPLELSDDFGAQRFKQSDQLSIHDHQFAAGNTAIPHMLELEVESQAAHRELLEDSVKVDIFAVREEGIINGNLRPFSVAQPGLTAKRLPTNLQAGKRYLLEVVIRTLSLGHHFTQGTSDSNQVWLNLVARTGDRVLAESGDLDEADMSVDPWAHFVNAYVIDRNGLRIDRRNPENIFTKLYDNQIPPGASDVVHYALEIPDDFVGDIELEVSLKYRKFDTKYLRYIKANKFDKNNLPILELATDRAQLKVSKQIHANKVHTMDGSPSRDWQSWNDYGIALLRREQFRQAEEAFKEVEQLGMGDGALNLARVYLKEGRLDEAAAALTRAKQARVPALPWTISYFTAKLNLQNGYFDEAILAFRDLVDTRFQAARDRNFDFSSDYRLLNELALAISNQAKLQRGSQNSQRANSMRQEAIQWYLKTLQLDQENVAAHYGLAQLYSQLGDEKLAAHHRDLHARYKVDDNAKDRAVQLARKLDPAADKAANRVVIYDLKFDSLP